MGFIKYSKYTGSPLGDSLSLEELLNMLADFLLHSGFGREYSDRFYNDRNARQSMQDLYDALLEALLNQGQLPAEWMEALERGENPADMQSLQNLLTSIIQRLAAEGYITVSQPQQLQRWTPVPGGAPGQSGPAFTKMTFEATDKTLDFLGYKTLKDLLGSLGKSSFGRHDTRDLATGVEASGAPKPYEFGDTLNLDISATLLNALAREGIGPTIEVDYQDLMVRQSEYQSSCATVLMLDCSHSMILYGEDRFTPAKKVALALAHLIRTQYPGDSLHVVLFHDAAEEIPLSQLARVKVGPYYTNTREGLRLAQRILQRQRKDMRQIIMITDGKPSAITQPDGRIYRNAFGLDPFIVTQTFREVDHCRKSGILINTFMLARDPDLVSFVKKITELCRGKAYFTTPFTLGQYILMDYMNKKTRMVH